MDKINYQLLLAVIPSLATIDKEIALLNDYVYISEKKLFEKDKTLKYLHDQILDYEYISINYYTQLNEIIRNFPDIFQKEYDILTHELDFENSLNKLSYFIYKAKEIEIEIQSLSNSIIELKKAIEKLNEEKTAFINEKLLHLLENQKILRKEIK